MRMPLCVPTTLSPQDPASATDSFFHPSTNYSAIPGFSVFIGKMEIIIISTS